MNARVEYLRARYKEEPEAPAIAMQRRMLDELYPELEGADNLIAGEWGSSDDLAGKLLDLLMLPYYAREDCRYDWVASADRKAEKCAHEDAYGVVVPDGSEVRQHCPDCGTTWPDPQACANCERCTWNPGPDCGKPEHPHCDTCGHCEGRHVRKGKRAPDQRKDGRMGT